MIVLDLCCDHEHRFEAWFASSEAFDTQLAAGLVSCPHCDSRQVRRLPSAPYVQTASHSAPTLPPPDPKAIAARLVEALRAAASQSEDVGERFAEPLSGLIDTILGKVAQGPDGERIRKHVLRLEQEIRTLVAGGAHGLFSELWDKAAKALTKQDKLVADSLSRARANLTVDGEVLDCNAELPSHLFGHAWSITQMRRARRFNEDLNRLVLKLSDIIQADYINSDAAKSAASLRDSFGAGALNHFNFDTMSAILKKVSVRDALPKRRRQRILGLISTLQAQKFFPVHGAPQGAVSTPYSFAFDSCAAALKAFHDRQPKLVELARALAVAELEARGEYNEARHDPLFAAFGENGLDAETLALFPDYLVRLDAADLAGAEQATLNEILAADLPIKVLVQSHDLLEKSPVEHGPLAFSLRSPLLGRMALGMGVFVLQAAAAALPQLRGALQRGLDHGGAALFSVYSGAGTHTASLPAYLVGAAASEARLFPAFCHDPSAGNDWAARFSLVGNAQPVTIDVLAVLFITSRLLYIICYLADWALLRSLVWFIGMGLIVSFFFVSM